MRDTVRRGIYPCPYRGNRIEMQMMNDGTVTQNYDYCGSDCRKYGTMPLILAPTTPREGEQQHGRDNQDVWKPEANCYCQHDPRKYSRTGRTRWLFWTECQQIKR